MENPLAEIGPVTSIPFGILTARMLLAVALGAVIGFEREKHDRPAGMRTHILVCLAAATVAILTIEITHMATFNDQAVRIDPIRLVEAVTGGVAFLAAGFIVFARGEIRGLTTGAGLWLAGAIGLACGLGFWPIALIAAFLALIVLWLLGVVERRYISDNGSISEKAKQRRQNRDD